MKRIAGNYIILQTGGGAPNGGYTFITAGDGLGCGLGAGLGLGLGGGDGPGEGIGGGT